MNEETRRTIAEATVPWDEMRQRRVLSRVEAALAERRQRSETSPRRTARILRWSARGLAVAAVLALAVWAVPKRSSDASDAYVPPRVAERGFAAPPTLTIPALPDPPTLALSDGSVAHLHDGARVDVDVQTDDLVRLLQSSGVVRYEVAPNPARRFVVDARGVEVRVIGTIFTVQVEEQHVRVAVERGRVAVESIERVAELGAGDEIRLETDPEETLVIVDEEPISRPASPDRGSKPKPIPSVDDLLHRADKARVKGELADAAAALSELVRRYPDDPRTYSSYFQLGKVERARGHHGAAASAFAACYKRTSTGALSEDARAEAAVSWLDAGRGARAQKAAQSHLDRYPKGAHADRMRRILDRTR